MRIKPEEEWHNFGFTYEKRLGKLEIALSLNAEVLKTFLRFAQEREKRGTGIRFKFEATAAQEIVEKKGELYLSYQLFSKDPYIFPNDSPHTNRFDSPYNRVEFYIPVDRVLCADDLQLLKLGETPPDLRLIQLELAL